MAARKRTWTDPKTREKIRTTKLLQRLQSYALGEDEPGTPGKKIEMSASQVKAAQVLINKRLPDLTAADINVNKDMPENKEEIFAQLVDKLGEELALKIAPEFVPKNRVLN